MLPRRNSADKRPHGQPGSRRWGDPSVSWLKMPPGLKQEGLHLGTASVRAKPEDQSCWPQDNVTNHLFVTCSAEPATPGAESPAEAGRQA